MKDRDKKPGYIKNVEVEQPDENVWSQHFDEKIGEYWLCSAEPSAKRMRTEEESHGGKPTKGKGKGKGPNGGCHECGGEHYVRDCRQGPQELQQKRHLGKAERF